MRLTVLGCSGTFPGPASPCSGYLVEHEGTRIVLDLGSGALGSLQRHCGLLDVAAVYVSHLHADHCIDLLAWSYARRYHPDGLPPRLPVYGPVGTEKRLCTAYEEPPADGLLEVFEFHETGPGTHRIGPFTLTTTITNHPIEAHAIRVEAGGRSLTYSADSAVSDALVELARDTDLFLCEASWLSTPTPPPDIHLTGREAGEHATRAGVGRLVLTHLMPFADEAAMVAEARETWSGPLEVARTDAVFEV